MGSHGDGSFTVAVFEDLEQCEPEVLVEGLEAEVIEDEQWYFFDLVERFDIRAIKFSGSDFFDKSVHVEVKGFVTHLAGMSAQRTGEEGFAATGGAGDEQILGLPDEVAGSEQGKLFGAEVSIGGTVHFGQYGIEAEFGQGEVELAFSMLAVLGFGLGERSEQVVGMGLLLGGELKRGGVGVGHAIEAKLVELIHGGLIVH